MVAITHGNSFIAEVKSSKKEDKINVNMVCKESEVVWILDCGCTDHIVNDDTLYECSIVLKNAVDVSLGDGRVLKATKIGKVKTMFKVYDDKEVEIVVPNVYYVKDMKYNLISYSKITKKNVIVSLGNFSEIYNLNNDLIATAEKRNNLYYMKSIILRNNQTEANNSFINKNDITLKER